MRFQPRPAFHVARCGFILTKLKIHGKNYAEVKKAILCFFNLLASLREVDLWVKLGFIKFLDTTFQIQMPTLNERDEQNFAAQVRRVLAKWKEMSNKKLVALKLQNFWSTYYEEGEFCISGIKK